MGLDTTLVGSSLLSTIMWWTVARPGFVCREIAAKWVDCAGLTCCDGVCGGRFIPMAPQFVMRPGFAVGIC